MSHKSFMRRFFLSVPFVLSVCVGTLNSTPSSNTSNPSQPSPLPPQNIEDLSELEFSTILDAVLLIKDNIGNSAGIVGMFEKRVAGIPGSECFIEPIDADDILDTTSKGSQIVTIDQPSKGIYTLYITALHSGPYDVSLRAFSWDGSRKPPLDIQGKLKQGASVYLKFKFDPQPGTALKLLTPVQPLPQQP